jgi:cytochrome c-type biogenesis protein CcmF
VEWDPISAQQATFKVFLNPLFNWLWIGGIVLIVGTSVAAWPEKEKVFSRERSKVVSKGLKVEAG